MKKISKYLFLMIPLVMVAAMLFPTRVYAQDKGTPADVPADPSTIAEPTSVLPEGATVANTIQPVPAIDSSTSDDTCTTNGDPHFKVGLTTYYFLLALPCPAGSIPGVTCFVSGTPIQDALNYISTHGTLPSDRKVYVEASAYTENVVLDGNAGTKTLANLIGLIGHSSADTTINGSLFIMGTKAGFTLSGFSLLGNVGYQELGIAGNIGALTLSDLIVKNLGNDGIQVFSHQGAITLNNVMASGSAGDGAFLNNSGYVTAYPITVSNSEFDDNLNGGTGLDLATNGVVTINGVSTSRNTGQGLFVSGASSVTINNLTALDNKKFGGTLGYGIYLSPKLTAPITMNNIFANNNENIGLLAYTNGAVTLSNLEVNGNGNIGLLVGSPSTLAGAVKVTNAQMNNNDQYGIWVNSKSTITLDTVDASGNLSYGAYLDNCQWNGVKCTGIGGITISSKMGSRFDHNGGMGLFITSGGAISLADFSASSNTNAGVYLVNNYPGAAGGITVKTTLTGWMNEIVGNNAFGLGIFSNGAIAVSNTNVAWNSTQGAVFSNISAPLAQAVAITNSSFNNNGTGEGLNVTSKGAITLTKVNAYGNLAANGAVLINTAGTAGVTIQTAADGLYGNFSGNHGYGIQITSKGAITVKGVNSDTNTRTGIVLDNLAGTSAGVTVNGGSASNNSGTNAYGLEVHTHGAISITKFSTGYNQMSGAVVDNTGVTTPAAVTVVSSSFYENGLTGLVINTKGNVTLTNISASYNGAWDSTSSNGVYVNTTLGSGTVTMNGTGNSFYGNGGEGLIVTSKGSISISNIDAAYNAYHGFWIMNDYTGSTGNITVTSTPGSYNNIYGNGFIDPKMSNVVSGAQINSFGNITIDRSHFYGNGNNGIWMSNQGGPTAKAITINDSSADGNQLDGFNINAHGTVTLKGVTADGNSRFERGIGMGSTVQDRLTSRSSADEWYYSGTIGQNITIELISGDIDSFLELYNPSGVLVASDDDGGGYPNAKIVYTLLATGVYRIEAHSFAYNTAGDYQLELYFTGNIPAAAVGPISYGISVSASGNVTVQALAGIGAVGSNNAADGVHIVTSGTVTGASMGGNDNGWGAVFIDNTSGAAKSVTLTNGIADSNDNYGYEILSNGTITLTGLSANNASVGAGFILNNSSAATPLAVTVNNPIANGNSTYGLFVFSDGAITVNHITANNNIYGAYLYSFVGGKITFKSLTGVNTLENNSGDGVHLSTSGAVVLDKILAEWNGVNGIHVENSSTVTLTNSKLLHNQNNGMEATANGLVTITNVMAIDNGNPGYAGDGVWLHLTSDPVVISNSIFISNHESGINIAGCSTYTITGSYYFGNNTNNYPFAPNLWCHP